MADGGSGESDEDEEAKLKEATEGALPVAIKPKDATKCEKRNDFNASKLAKLLDDMIEYTETEPIETSTEPGDTGVVKLLSSSKGVVTVTDPSHSKPKSAHH